MKKMLITVILTLISTSISTSAMAEWTLIQSSDDADMYIDFDLMETSAGLLKAWTLTDYKSRQENQVLSATWRELYDCNIEKFKVLSISKFSESMGAGKSIELINFNDAHWSAVVPYSIGELKSKIICSKK